MQHVLLVYQQLIPSAILCGHAQLEYLASAGKIEYEHCCSHQVTAEMISRSDTVVIIRGALDFDLLTAKTAKRAGKRVVYVLDDDLFNVPGHIERLTDSAYSRNFICLRKTFCVEDAF